MCISGCASFEIRTPPHFGRTNLEPSQATASKHRSPHSVRVRVRVRVGWSASGATAKKLVVACRCGGGGGGGHGQKVGRGVSVWWWWWWWCWWCSHITVYYTMYYTRVWGLGYTTQVSSTLYSVVLCVLRVLNSTSK